MLNKPVINELMQHVDSKYALVILAAKTARTIIEDNPDMVASGVNNPVSMALNDIVADKIAWEMGE